MNEWLQYISYTGYGLVGVFGLLLGLVYSLSPRIMPYHQQALGLKWEQLSDESRWMLLNYQRSVAAGFISSSITVLTLLCIPYPRGERWAIIAIFVISLLQWGNIVCRTRSVKRHTNAKPPLGVLMILLGVLVISFVASMIANG